MQERIRRQLPTRLTGLLALAVVIALCPVSAGADTVQADDAAAAVTAAGPARELRDGPTRHTRGRLTTKVTGELLGQSATIVVRGRRGSAKGYRRVLRVRSAKTLRLPAGKYRVQARLIKTDPPSHPHPILADTGRTSAAMYPRQRTTITGSGTSMVRFHYPPPPKFPRNFTGTGRFIVRDLGFDVPFTWNARNGEIQMVAGGWRHPIYFVNLIKDHVLYTKTYKWPGTEGVGECVPVGPLDRKFFNDWFETSRYVGPVELQGNDAKAVNHFRASAVIPLQNSGPGNYLRFGIGAVDMFVDQSDSRVFWSVPHFGYQNLLDPHMDEWIQMGTFDLKPGRLDPPADCQPK